MDWCYRAALIAKPGSKMKYLFTHGVELMRTMEYTGFTNKTCFCRYQITEIDGQQIVIFEQSARIQTSITNVIEDLASQVLENDLRGTEPSEVRFFEYYPSHLRPLVDWQEVKFRDVDPVYKDIGLSEKIRALFGAKQSPERWSVEKPEWSPVSQKMKSQLQSVLH